MYSGEQNHEVSEEEYHNVTHGKLVPDQYNISAEISC